MGQIKLNPHSLFFSSHNNFDLEKVCLPLLLVISSVAIFFQLGARSLENQCYIRYAEAAREMIRSGDWIVPPIRRRAFSPQTGAYYLAYCLTFCVRGEGHAFNGKASFCVKRAGDNRAYLFFREKDVPGFSGRSNCGPYPLKLQRILLAGEDCQSGHGAYPFYPFFFVLFLLGL
jgi:hypothetical protein